MAQTGCWKSGRACPLCPGISDINLFRYCQGIIYFDAEISDSAFDLGMPEQKLDGPEISGPPVDQRGFRASQRMRSKQPRVRPGDERPVANDPKQALPLIAVSLYRWRSEAPKWLPANLRAIR